MELTGSKSKLVYRPLPADDPTQRQPDITLAEEASRLAADGSAARRAGQDDRLVPLDRPRTSTARRRRIIERRLTLHLQYRALTGTRGSEPVPASAGVE